MSNIQITENESGKYSPEWFYSESQTPEWISFAHKADELRENFINLFGIEHLKSLSGKDLLTSLFYNDEGNKTNLCYMLEMDKEIREVFGSISGGAAYKFGLFYHKKNQSWTCGSPLKPVLLTEDEAIQKADEMRNDLVEGAEIISSFGSLDSEEDYKQLYIQLEHIPGINMVCPAFMEYVAMVKPKGMKTRARYEFIKNFNIPVPSLPVQQKILDIYHTKLGEAEDNIKKGNNYSDGLLLNIQSGVSDFKKEVKKENVSSSILQIIPFTSTRRWEVGYIQKEGRLESVYNSFKYTEYRIKDLQVESLFGLSVKASLEQKKGMIPVLRMSNVINGELDFSELKYLPASCASTAKEPNKWILRKGDFLITRTNGSKDLVGKSAVFDSDDVYTYASYLIRYRFDTSIVLPEYVNILFMTPLVREQIAVMRRQGGGQYNLNSDEIGAIRIPVPSIPIQQDIVKRFNDAKDGAKVYYGKADECKTNALKNFEKEIFL